MSIYKHLFFKILHKMSIGHVVVVDGNKEYRFGKGSDDPIKVNINDKRAYKLFITKGALGAGTAYIKQYWQTNHLSQLLSVVAQNQSVFKGMDGLLSKFNYFKESLLFKLKNNSIVRAKENIKAHYDLSNDFFKLFLDKFMMYSCAIFDNPKQGLDEASENKLKIICDKLELKQNDTLLEIGSGWGGLAVYAAQNYGCNVTTTTVSDEQYNYVSKLIKNLRLNDRIKVLNQDYRKLTGKFDKIVSIEMIEAVGYQYFSVYFKKINELVKEKGRVLIQAITSNDPNYKRAKKEVDFINKYIFPGGCLPSLDIIRKNIKEETSLFEIDIENIGQHYVKTLNLWAEKFKEQLQYVKSLGFSSEFINKWMFYFAYCQAGFETKLIDDVQLLWEKN